MSETCIAPRCKRPRVEGGRGCDLHQQIYTRVRKEVEEPRNRQYVVRRDRVTPRTCRVEDCDEPRARGSEFCRDHEPE